MRALVLGFMLMLVLLPALLILFARGQSLLPRIAWGGGAFLAPFIMLGAVQVLAALTNNSSDYGQWGRLLGLILTGTGFILPWIIFALFLHWRGSRV